MSRYKKIAVELTQEEALILMKAAEEAMEDRHEFPGPGSEHEEEVLGRLATRLGKMHLGSIDH